MIRMTWALALTLIAAAGCASPLPIDGRFRGDFQGEARVTADARVAADVRLDGPIRVDLPLVSDPGPIEVRSVIASKGGGPAPRIALIDVDGLLLNQNLTGPYSMGENPVDAFREKLRAASEDPAVAAVVLRINSPGGGVTACDIMAEELRRFRAESRRPTVACLMDVAAAGAYYVAIGADRIVAHPTGITGGVGALFNHYNLQDAMAQLNVTYDPIKTGDLVDMGSVAGPLSDASVGLLGTMVDRLQGRFLERLAEHRPMMSAADRETVADGRIVLGDEAVDLHLADRTGYLLDAIAEAKGLSGIEDAEVVLYQRSGSPSRTLYGVTPNTPLQGDLLPFSYPGLDRSKLPTFLYLWQPDPSLLRQAGH